MNTQKLDAVKNYWLDYSSILCAFTYQSTLIHQQNCIMSIEYLHTGHVAVSDGAVLTVKARHNAQTCKSVEMCHGGGNNI